MALSESRNDAPMKANQGPIFELAVAVLDDNTLEPPLTTAA